MRVERTSDGRVEVWLEEDGDEPDQAADLSFTVEQLNALVIEWLRGYPGPPGPVGAPGA